MVTKAVSENVGHHALIQEETGDWLGISKKQISLCFSYAYTVFSCPKINQCFSFFRFSRIFRPWVIFCSRVFCQKYSFFKRKVIRCDAHIRTTYFSCSIRSHVIMLEHVRGSMLCTVSGRAYATFPPLPHISKKRRVVFPPAGGLKNYCMTKKKTVWGPWEKRILWFSPNWIATK